MSQIQHFGPDNTQRDTTIRDLLSVVFKRKWLILAIFATATGLVLAKMFATPASYTATATFMVNRLDRASTLDTYTKALKGNEVIETELEVIQSIEVLQRARGVLAQPTEEGVAPITLGLNALAKSVKSGTLGESSVIYAACSAPVPGDAIRMINAVAKAYVDYHTEYFQLPNASALIHAKADSIYAVLQGYVGERETLLSRVGLVDPDKEEYQLVAGRGRLRSELAEAERSKVKLESEVASIAAARRGDAQTLPVLTNMAFAHGKSLGDSAAELREAQSNLLKLQAKYTAQHPRVQDAVARIKMLQVDVGRALDEASTIKNHELRAARDEVTELRRQIRHLDLSLSQLPGLVSQLDLLNARIESAKEQYQSLTKQSAEADVRTRSYRDFGVRLLSPAMTAKKNQKADMVRLALGPLLALLAGIGLAFYMENLDHSVANRDDIERHMEIPVFASFPDVDSMEDEMEISSPRRIPFRGRSKQVS